MHGWLKSLLGSKEHPAVPSTLEGEVVEAAERFSNWGRKVSGGGDSSSIELVDRALNALFEQEKIPGEAQLSDAASAVGEAFRGRFGGEWEEVPWLGLVLSGAGGIDTARLNPLAIVERKKSNPGGFSLEELAGSLEKRFEMEGKAEPWPGVSTEEIIERLKKSSDGHEANVAAQQVAMEFRAHWEERMKASIPLSLVGVRALDGFLRSHYLVCFLGEGDLARAGFFLGEVGRGLFQGQWNFEGIDHVADAQLVYPELAYYPVGRVFKMMTERPVGEPLDEYLRLIPSARKELREQSAGGD